DRRRAAVDEGRPRHAARGVSAPGLVLRPRAAGAGRSHGRGRCRPRSALCVLDRVPRTLSPERQRALRGLAQQAMAQIELRRAYAELRHHAAERAWYEQQMESVWRQMAEQNARLTQASLTDELTGLPNRRAAGLRLAQLLEGLASGDGPLAVAIADIDFFKAINDRHGHPVGDDVLLRVAGALGA